MQGGNESQRLQCNAAQLWRLAFPLSLFPSSECARYDGAPLIILASFLFFSPRLRALQLVIDTNRQTRPSKPETALPATNHSWRCLSCPCQHPYCRRRCCYILLTKIYAQTSSHLLGSCGKGSAYETISNLLHRTCHF